jgi:hypothetical protein
MLHVKYGSGVGEIVGRRVGVCVAVGSRVAVGSDVAVNVEVTAGTWARGIQDAKVNTAKVVINKNRFIPSMLLSR